MRLAIDLFITIMIGVVLLICIKVGMEAMAEHQGRLQDRYEQQYRVVSQQ